MQYVDNWMGGKIKHNYIIVFLFQDCGFRKISYSTHRAHQPRTRLVVPYCTNSESHFLALLHDRNPALTGDTGSARRASICRCIASIRSG